MAQIAGRLLVDLFTDDTVRIVFSFAHIGGGNECPIVAKNLDAAEIDFVTMCGLTPGRAAMLRVDLERNKVVSVETNIEEEVAAKFRFPRETEA